MFVTEFRLPFGLNEVGMIRTIYFRCELPRAMAEALNAESGRIYSEVMVEHYRVWRKKGVWLSRNADERMHDAYHAGQPRLLQAHSIDAAQQGFAKACQTTRAARKAGAPQTRMPYKRARCVVHAVGGGCRRASAVFWRSRSDDGGTSNTR
jgi:hypothetical protein